MIRNKLITLTTGALLFCGALGVWAYSGQSVSGNDSSSSDGVGALLSRPDFSAQCWLEGDTSVMSARLGRFVDGLHALPSDSLRSEAVAAMVDRIAQDSMALALFGEIAENLLNSTSSPRYNEGDYLLFLNQLAVTPAMDEGMRERYAWQLSDMNRARPGAIAPDFSFVTFGGTTSTLSELTTVHDSTLMVVYDPDCHDCHRLIDSMRSDAALNAAIAAKSLAILAIYPYGDEERWRADAPLLPTNWLIARPSPDTDLESLYYLPRTPRTYLLSPSRQILRLHE